nr:CidA/LrgA family protein [uncultured Cohaesibacter sp.]
MRLSEDYPIIFKTPTGPERRKRGTQLLFYLTVILLCQLIGEALVTLFDLPVPGAVFGMAIMFIGLLIKGSVPDGLSSVGDTLLSHMSLLFIPAGVGIMVNAELIQREIVPIAVSLVISTFLCIAVTGLLMSWLTRNKSIGGYKE